MKWHKFFTDIFSTFGVNGEEDITIPRCDGRQKISQFLPYRIYDAEHDMYLNANSCGFIRELNPLTGGDEETSKILTQMITDGLPEGCVVSFLNWASPCIEDFLEFWCKPRLGGLDIYRKQALERKKFLMAGTRQSLLETPFVLRNFRCFLVVAMAVTTDLQVVREKEKLMAFRRILEGTLKTIGLIKNQESFGPELLLSLLGEIFGTDVDERIVYDPLSPLNRQVMGGEQSLRVMKDGIVFQKTGQRARLLTVKNYPSVWAQWQCSELIGSLESDYLRLGCPFLTCFSFMLEGEEAQRRRAMLRSTRLTQQCDSSMAKFMPQLREQKNDWDFVLEKILTGQKLLKVNYTVALMADAATLEEEEQVIKSLYRRNGWLLQTCNYVQLPLFLAALPFVLADGLARDFNLLEQWKTMVSWTCANLLPIQGEWKGMDSPHLLLLGRRGQPFCWNPFANREGNYNVAVVGKSGSGKSVFLQELVASLRGSGCRVYVIDDGRSFMNTCQLQQGRFIIFGEDTNVCLNPFSLVNPIALEQDANYRAEIINLLVSIVMAMCFNVTSADDYQTKIIEEAVLAVFAVRKTEATITDIRHYLERQQDNRRQDLATLLMSFSAGGKYEKYFEGCCNLEIDNDLMVFEMAELKNRKDLQSVVLLLLMFVVSHRMYFGDRRVNTALVIDEAWDLLAGGSAVGKFIEGFARRCRKYGGSLITGTQSINDYYRNDGARAAFENSDWSCLLAQKSESIEDLRRSGKFILDRTREKVLKSLRMKDKQYSEVMINGTDGFVVGRLVLDKFSLAMYSSRAEDFAAIQDLQRQGYGLAEAVELRSYKI
jgi:conjugal transfer ATP-binding protein TraC